MKMLNQVKMTFASRSVNESFFPCGTCGVSGPGGPDRAAAGRYQNGRVRSCHQLHRPCLSGYRRPHYDDGCFYEGGNVRITISDKGVGIPDVAKAMEPMYTTGNPDERAGLGFAVMQSFMDRVHVSSAPGRGTRVTMSRHLDSR